MSTSDDLTPLPPRNEEAEVAVLGAVMLSAEFGQGVDLRPVMGLLEPGDFYLGRHQCLWGIIRALWTAGKPVDAISVWAEVERRQCVDDVGGRDRFITMATSASSAALVDSHAALVKQCADRRRIIAAGSELVRAARDGFEDPASLVERVSSIATRTVASGVKDDGLGVEDMVLAAGDTHREWLIECLIPEGGFILFGSDAAKDGKSYLVAAMVAAIERGGTVIDLAATDRPCATVWLSEESPLTLVPKFQRFGIKHCHAYTRQVLQRPWALRFAMAVEKAKSIGARLIVVDTFSFWTGLVGDEANSSGAVEQAVKCVQQATTHGIAVLMLHHLSKSKDLQGINRFRNSTALGAAADGYLLMQKPGGPTSRIRSLYGNGRYDGFADGVTYEYRDGSLVRITSQIEAAVSTTGDRIAEIVKGHPGISRTAIAKEIGGRRSIVLGAIEAMIRAGTLTDRDGGLWLPETGAAPPAVAV